MRKCLSFNHCNMNIPVSHSVFISLSSWNEYKMWAGNTTCFIVWTYRPEVWSTIQYSSLRVSRYFNPITFCMIWNLIPIMVQMILADVQNFKSLAFLLLEIWRHTNFFSRMEQVIAIRNRAKLKKKSLLMPENIFPCTNLYHFHGFEAKQKIPYVQLLETSHFKNSSSAPPPPPPVNRSF